MTSSSVIGKQINISLTLSEDTKEIFDSAWKQDIYSLQIAMQQQTILFGGAFCAQKIKDGEDICRSMNLRYCPGEDCLQKVKPDTIKCVTYKI